MIDRCAVPEDQFWKSKKGYDEMGGACESSKVHYEVHNHQH